jgi:hypothetical protein
VPWWGWGGRRGRGGHATPPGRRRVGHARARLWPAAIVFSWSWFAAVHACLAVAGPDAMGPVHSRRGAEVNLVISSRRHAGFQEKLLEDTCRPAPALPWARSTDRWWPPAASCSFKIKKRRHTGIFEVDKLRCRKAGARPGQTNISVVCTRRGSVACMRGACARGGAPMEYGARRR